VNGVFMKSLNKAELHLLNAKTKVKELFGELIEGG